MPLSVRRRRQSLRQRASVLAAALVGFVLSTSAVWTEAADATKTWAAGLKNLAPEQGQTLLKVARDLLPHEELADSSYTVCIDPYDAAASDPQSKEAIEDALKAVRDASRRMGYTSYVDISDEYERLRLAKMLAEGRWMRQFKSSLQACLDGQPDVKAKLKRN